VTSDAFPIKPNHRLRLAWNAIRSPRWQPVIYAEVGALIVLALAVMPGGFDYLHFFHKVAQGCVKCAYNPYFMEWFLKPLGLLPWRSHCWSWRGCLAASPPLVFPPAPDLTA
jgi:hypothetical protein